MFLSTSRLLFEEWSLAYRQWTCMHSNSPTKEQKNTGWRHARPKTAQKKNGLKLKRFTYYSFNYKRLCNFLSDIFLVSPRGIRLGGGGTTYDGLYGDALLERGIFFKLQVFKRVGKYVIWVCIRANRLILWLKKVEKTLNFCDWFPRKS